MLGIADQTGVGCSASGRHDGGGRQEPGEWDVWRRRPSRHGSQGWAEAEIKTVFWSLPVVRSRKIPASALPAESSTERRGVHTSDGGELLFRVDSLQDWRSLSDASSPQEMGAAQREP